MIEKNTGKQENEQIKGLICHMWLILYYTERLVIPYVVINCKVLGQIVSEKSLTKISICITLE